MVCWKNPANKCCSTCKHEVYFKEVEEIYDPAPMKSSYMVRDCKILSENDLMELIENSGYHTSQEYHILPVRNCPYWTPKE